MANVKISFITSDNEVFDVEVPEGTTVLEAAHSNGVPLEGSCEGSLACSTCHVILEEDYFNKTVKLSEDGEIHEDELDMLDMAFGLTETSRLGCQIMVTPELEGMKLRIPARTRNTSGK